MKRIHWLTMLGVSGTGLAALLLGQTVLGQPDTKDILPLPPPMVVTKPEVPMAPAALPELQPGPTATPLFPDSPADPGVPTILPASPIQSTANVQSSPQGTKADAVMLDAQLGKQQPAVSIEWTGPATVRLNHPGRYQLVVRNTSTSPVQNVIVRHRLGQGVTCKSSEPQAANDAGEMVWNLGTLPPDQPRRIDLTLISQTRGTMNQHATVTFTGGAVHQVQVQEPQLLVKMSGPAKVIAGENVTLLFLISNPGDGIAEGVKVKMMLPDGLEHPRGKTVEFDVGNIQPKEIRKAQIVCQSTGSGAQKCAIVASGDGGLVSNDTAHFEILMPKLDVALSGPKFRYLDRHAVYVLKVTNPGSAAASNVEVQELIPTGFKFHQANLGGKFQEGTRLVSWSLGDLPAGQSKTLAVELIPVEAGEHRLIAHAKAARGLKSEADARTLVEGLPSLSIEVGHVDDPLEVGAETFYEIRVANTGTKTETNVEVVCTLPAQLDFRGAKCSAPLRYRQDSREVIFEPLPRLAPKADVIYRVQVKGAAPGDIRFRTRIKADGLKDPVMREESMRIYSDDAPVRSTAAPTPAPLPIKSAPQPISSVPAPTPISNVPAPTPIGRVPAPTPRQMPVVAPKQLPSVPPLPTPTIPSSVPALPPPNGPISLPPPPVSSAPAPLPALPSPPANRNFGN